MNQAVYAAVDWGTSSFRLWLIDAARRVLVERRSNEGMTTAASSGFGNVLQAHLAAVNAASNLPVIICGMAGARQGWIEAGYLDTPASLALIPMGAVRVPGLSRDIRILPGIAQRQASAPDVMRGEETQLLGALGEGTAEAALVCMPGTHSKWVEVSQGTVVRFTTFMTGELFSVISRETVLAHALAGADPTEDRGAFEQAVIAAFETPARAANLLFQVRARQLLFGGTAAAARETISGTLIGLELAAALPKDMPTATVTLVASGRLAALYRAALGTLSIPVRTIEADDAVRSGLAAAAKMIWG